MLLFQNLQPAHVVVECSLDESAAVTVETGTINNLRCDTNRNDTWTERYDVAKLTQTTAVCGCVDVLIRAEGVFGFVRDNRDRSDPFRSSHICSTASDDCPALDPAFSTPNLRRPFYGQEFIDGVYSNRCCAQSDDLFDLNLLDFATNCGVLHRDRDAQCRSEPVLYVPLD